MLAVNMSSSNKYPIYLFLTLIIMVLISGYMFYQLWPRYTKNYTFFPQNNQKKVIYILQSEDNIKLFFDKINASPENYLKGIQSLKEKLKKIGYNPKIITETKIKTLPNHAILIAFDVYALSKKHLFDLEDFLKKGGNLIFNYHFAYFIDKKFVDAKNIERITSLKKLNETIRNISSQFIAPKVLSPLAMSSLDTQRIEAIIYKNDALPLYESKQVPDAILINWALNSTPYIKNKPLDVKKAGVAWHGTYKNGKWFYFSLPQYVFVDLPIENFKFLMDNMYKYLSNDITILPYPYIDEKKVVFISEDTEYKYENMIHFAKLANEKNINVTLFCVANLAQKYKEITHKAAQLPRVEIGSHSYSHSKIMGTSKDKVIKEIKGSKEILEQITGKTVYGFRPPREEIDSLMEKILAKSGYIYVMEKVKPFLLPKSTHPNLITIPRHGTDDYTYVIGLDWNKSQILNNIIHETQVLTSMNALFTLSVHTHLLSYKSNLDVTSKYFDYLNNHKDIKALKGVDIAKRAIIFSNLKITTENFSNKVAVTITNDSDYPIINGKFRIYHPNIEIKKISSELINTSIKVIKTTKEYTDVEINKIPPKTSSIFFISY